MALMFCALLKGAGSCANAASVGANTVAFKPAVESVAVKPVLLIAAFKELNTGSCVSW